MHADQRRLPTVVARHDAYRTDVVPYGRFGLRVQAGPRYTHVDCGL